LWKDCEQDDVTRALPALLKAVNTFGDKEFLEQDLNDVTHPDTEGLYYSGISNSRPFHLQIRGH